MVAARYERRLQQRGGITEAHFLAEMQRAGFRSMPERAGFLHEFEHGATGHRRYCMEASEGFAHALVRFHDELAAGRRHAASSMT